MNYLVKLVHVRAFLYQDLQMVKGKVSICDGNDDGLFDDTDKSYTDSNNV
jgi:hypothetical protein